MKYIIHADLDGEKEMNMSVTTIGGYRALSVTYIDQDGKIRTIYTTDVDCLPDDDAEASEWMDELDWNTID